MKAVSTARRLSYVALALLALAAIAAVPSLALPGQQTKINVLRIGTSGTIGDDTDAAKDKSALQTLRDFIKDETGLDNEILAQKDWRQLTEKLAKGDLQVGAYQGYEFAWAQGKDPELRPLAIAVNVQRYPVIYVVTAKNSNVKDFAGLQGKTFSIPTGERYLRLFINKECKVAGKEPEKFFSKITSPNNIDDAVDDVVDGVTTATVAEQAALEAYRRSKPARFKKLKEIAKSQALPPPVIAYYDKHLDDATLKQLKAGLLGASSKTKGQTMLTLFRLTGFETVPADFGKVLAESRKNYPPDDQAK
jgi:ABC-type phosphate/phosphonate transport system substrate-binding protein